MKYKIIKPFGVSVEAAFRRIEILSKYLEYFPPSCSRGQMATSAQWEAQESVKKLSLEEKKEIKYNLLPDSYHARFDELETDWTDMSHSKFLAEAQKFEASDTKERLKNEKQQQQREKLKHKRKDNDESGSNLSRSQKERNSTFKKRRDNNPTTNAGKAQFCELCKAAGVPDFVFKSYNTNECKKKDQYAKALSGGARQRKKARTEYRRSEVNFQKELKILQHRFYLYRTFLPT